MVFFSNGGQIGEYCISSGKVVTQLLIANGIHVIGAHINFLISHQPPAHDGNGGNNQFAVFEETSFRKAHGADERGATVSEFVYLPLLSETPHASPLVTPRYWGGR